MAIEFQAGVSVEGDLHVTGNFTVDGTAPELPGVVKAYVFASPPTGWAICNGAVLTSASALRTALISAGYPFGQSGSDPKLPDYRDRFLMGASGTVAVGATGGASSHTHTVSVSPHGVIEDAITGVDVVNYVGNYTTSSGSTIPPYSGIHWIIKL